MDASPRFAPPLALAVSLALFLTLSPAGTSAGTTAEAPLRDAACPQGAELEAAVAALPLERTTRATDFASPLPEGLLERALAEPGEVAVERRGKKGHALALVPLPRPLLWRAVNDEDRYAGALGLEASRVVGGTPRGTDRLLFQAVERFGVGRWWVDRVRLNAGLQEESGGALWELVWTDAFDAWEPAEAPSFVDLRSLTEDLRPLEWTRGAWVMAELTPECTLVDYFFWSDPGGVLSAVQALGTKGAIRDTVEGLISHARAGVPDPAPGEPPFVDPTGSPLTPSRLYPPAGSLERGGSQNPELSDPELSPGTGASEPLPH